jgi:hypothetical protein
MNTLLGRFKKTRKDSNRTHENPICADIVNLFGGDIIMIKEAKTKAIIDVGK